MVYCSFMPGQMTVLTGQKAILLRICPKAGCYFQLCKLEQKGVGSFPINMGVAYIIISIAKYLFSRVLHSPLAMPLISKYL